MTSRLRLRALAGLLAGGLALGGLALASPAQAATTDGHHHLKPEFFTIKIVNDFSRVEAFGPVHGVGTDQETNNPALDILVFTFPPRSSVNVWHDPTPDPAIDFGSCTATVDQFGGWKFKGGTGKYEHAFGFGHFKLHLFAILRHKHHHHGCDTKDQPVFVKVFVTAWGLATAGRHGHDPAG